MFVYLPGRNLDNVSLMQCCATENWLIFDTSLSFVENSGHLIWVRRSCCKSSATHLYQYVQYFYMCPNNGMVASIWNFNMCTDVDACDCTWGCRDATRESAMGVDSRREIYCHTGDPNPCQYCAWLFGQMLYQLSYPGPTTYAQGWRNACQILLVQHAYFLCHRLFNVDTAVALYQTLFFFFFLIQIQEKRHRNHHL